MTSDEIKLWLLFTGFTHRENDHVKWCMVRGKVQIDYENNGSYCVFDYSTKDQDNLVAMYVDSDDLINKLIEIGE